MVKQRFSRRRLDDCRCMLQSAHTADLASTVLPALSEFLWNSRERSASLECSMSMYIIMFVTSAATLSAVVVMTCTLCEKSSSLCMKLSSHLYLPVKLRRRYDALRSSQKHCLYWTILRRYLFEKIIESSYRPHCWEHSLYWNCEQTLRIFELAVLRCTRRTDTSNMSSSATLVGFLFYLGGCFALPTICDVVLATKLIELPTYSNFCNVDAPQSSSLCGDRYFVSTLYSCNDHGEIKSLDLSSFDIFGNAICSPVNVPLEL